MFISSGRERSKIWLPPLDNKTTVIWLQRYLARERSQSWLLATQDTHASPQMKTTTKTATALRLYDAAMYGSAVCFSWSVPSPLSDVRSHFYSTALSTVYREGGGGVRSCFCVTLTNMMLSYCSTLPIKPPKLSLNTRILCLN